MYFSTAPRCTFQPAFTLRPSRRKVRRKSRICRARRASAVQRYADRAGACVTPTVDPSGCTGCPLQTRWIPCRTARVHTVGDPEQGAPRSPRLDRLANGLSSPRLAFDTHSLATASSFFPRGTQSPPLVATLIESLSGGGAV